MGAVGIQHFQVCQISDSPGSAVVSPAVYVATRHPEVFNTNSISQISEKNVETFYRVSVILFCYSSNRVPLNYKNDLQSDSLFCVSLYKIL